MIRQTALVVTVVVATGAVSTIGLSSAAAKSAPGGGHPEFWAGADISTAHASEGRLHLSATFRRASTYVAVFVPGHGPPNGRSRGGHHFDLGHRAVGTGHLSIPLGMLPPGPWSVFVAFKPLHHAVAIFENKPPKDVATWVYLTKYGNGQVSVGRIVTP